MVVSEESERGPLVSTAQRRPAASSKHRFRHFHRAPPLPSHSSTRRSASSSLSFLHLPPHRGASSHCRLLSHHPHLSPATFLATQPPLQHFRLVRLVRLVRLAQLLRLLLMHSLQHVLSMLVACLNRACVVLVSCLSRTCLALVSCFCHACLDSRGLVLVSCSSRACLVCRDRRSHMCPSRLSAMRV